ncbi:MAG TPA: pyridoxamine 5'-phosphate oxidase family protein [Arachnia sp.]|nr:pyridoxamine 5'-phosphate oxidase family protein [Arachnia sp.]
MTTDPQPVTYFSRLDADECWALVSEAVVGRIAWTSPEGISVVPVNFRVVEGVIVFHTTQESFLAGLAVPTEVAFQVDEIDQETATGWSVLVRGLSGPADAAVSSISWLEGGLTVGLAITASTIAGRVVSGTFKS